MLSNFFRINLPYGIIRNDKGEWSAFNREYSPLGFHERHIDGVDDMPIYTKYKGLSESILLSIAEKGEDSVKRDKKGEIYQIWLYDDQTNPTSQRTVDNAHWQRYWERLEILAKLNVSK